MYELKKYYIIILNEINNFTNDVIITSKKDMLIYEMLKEYCIRGKLIRGSLILAINEIFNNEISEDAIKLALSVELMHSSILIIDDIIDKDKLRRGKPSMHILASKLIPNSKDIFHDSESIAQCIGLIGTYHSFNLISNLDFGTKIIAEEFIKTGFAELNEIIIQQNENYSENDVFSIYENKTARYTITLPFKLGYLISNKEFNDEIERITILLGIIFQIKDDLLELQSNSNEIGKSNLSDIRSGKKHLPRKILENLVNFEDKILLNKYYDKLDDESVIKIKKLYDKYEIVSKVNQTVVKLNDELDLLIDKQDIKIKHFLIKLKEYVYLRTK